MDNLITVNFSMQLIVIIGIIGTGVVFFIYAQYLTEKQITVDGYLLAQHTVSGSEFSDTFTAASVSLASNIMFMISAHKEYGYIMFILPLFYCLIQYFFLITIKKYSLNLKEMRSIADIWSHMFSGKIIPKCIAMLCTITCMMGIFVELLVGSEILSVFLPNTVLYKSMAFFILGLIVTLYVYYGGYKGIVKTDTIQFYLMLIAVIAMMYFSIKSPILNNVNPTHILSNLLIHGEKGITLFIFLAWGISSNILLAVTDIAMWQRMAASASIQDSLVGFIKGSWKIVVAYAFPVMAFVILYLKGNNYNTMPQFLNIVLTQSAGIESYIIFPLIVIGFAAALFSTADTSMIASLYALSDKHTFLPKLEKITNDAQKNILRKYLAIFYIALFLILSILFYIAQSKIGKWIIPIMYAVWGQICILAPLIMYALYRIITKKPYLQTTKAQNYILMVSLIIGWCIVLAGAFTTVHLYSQITFLLSNMVSCIGLLISFKLMPKFQRNANIIGSKRPIFAT